MGGDDDGEAGLEINESAAAGVGTFRVMTRAANAAMPTIFARRVRVDGADGTVVKTGISRLHRIFMTYFTIYHYVEIFLTRFTSLYIDVDQ
jgi:hypothetical protein